MSKIIIMILIGLVGGVIGGMGMGGGTFLIPLLTIFCSVNQHEAQCMNLVAFVPMSVAALILHFKNKLIKINYALWIAIPAVTTSLVFAYLAKNVSAQSLAKYFGIFLVILGIYQLVTAIKTPKKQKQSA